MARGKRGKPAFPSKGPPKKTGLRPVDWPRLERVGTRPKKEQVGHFGKQEPVIAGAIGRE